MTYDLENLRLIGWALLTLASIGFAINEGITLGACLLLPTIAKDTQVRHQLIRCIAPTNLVGLAWLTAWVTLLFAAWPIAFAVSLASLKTAFVLIILSLLPRPLLLYFIDASDHPRWQQYGHKILVASGLIPAILFSLLVGNLLKGIPFHLESDMRIAFLGDFMSLLNLFSLLVCACGVALLAMQGAAYLHLHAYGELQRQAKAMLQRSSLAFVVLFALAGLWITHLEGYHISSEVFPDAPSNPLAKFVKRGEGLWLDNYEHLPFLATIPALAFIGAIAVFWLARNGRAYWAMLASTTCVTMTTLTVAISMFPFLLPSNLSLNSSLTLWDSSASQPTLQLLLSVTVIALPLMLVCGRWSFSVFRNPIPDDGNATNMIETADDNDEPSAACIESSGPATLNDIHDPL